MTEEEFRNLAPGDIVQSALGDGYIVTGKTTDGVVLTRTKVATNRREWKLIHKAWPIGSRPQGYPEKASTGG